MLILPYVYKITNNTTNEFYIGSRYKNVQFQRTPQEDILIYYFTSGILKQELKENPSNFKTEILFTFADSDVVYWYEQLLIREAFKNSKILCRNGKFVDPDTGHEKFSSTGKTWILTNQTKTKMKNYVKTKEHKEKISKALQGKSRDKFSQEWLDNLSKSHIGKTTGPRSEEFRNKIKLAKQKSKLQCPHCGTVGAGSNMKRWHFDNCQNLTGIKIKQPVNYKTCEHCGKLVTMVIYGKFHGTKCKQINTIP